MSDFDERPTSIQNKHIPEERDSVRKELDSIIIPLVELDSVEELDSVPKELDSVSKELDSVYNPVQDGAESLLKLVFEGPDPSTIDPESVNESKASTIQSFSRETSFSLIRACERRGDGIAIRSRARK